VSPALLAALVEEMANAIGRASLVVRVSPADAPALREHLPGVTIQADPTVSAGAACSSPNGEIDASFEATIVGLEAILSRWGGE
jgi:flagellar biosynthesis/type III secretory pathway protein FliH